MATTEDIEARLAAYIDCELDDVARAEIERHLASNAQHRVLIAELTRQRDFLRALPRQRAPFEIAENVNAHLERSALLGDGDDTHDRIIRISHWPQIKAVAAVLLLMFSLAAVVYYVVSSPGAHEEIAIVAPPAVMTDSAARSSVPTTDETGTVLTGTGLPDLDRHIISPQISRTQGGLAAEVPSARGPVILPAPDRSTMRESTGVAVGVDSAPAQQILVAVSAPDPMAAQRNVKSYLLSNQLEFSEEPAEAMPEPLKLQASNVALGSRLQQTRVQMKPGGALGKSRGTADNVERDRHDAAIDAEQPSTQPGEHDLAVARQQTQNFYRVRNLSRNEAEALYTSMSDDSQTAVVLQAPSAEKLTMGPMSLSPATQPTAPEEWQGLSLDLVPLPGLLHLTPPAPQENLEVVIVFNSSGAVDLPLEPATQPAEEEVPPADAEPTTAPATLPSSP